MNYLNDLLHAREESDATLFFPHQPGRMAGGGVVMKDGSVAEKVEKTSATADADLIEERAAFEQRPKEGRKEGGREGRGMSAVTTTTRTDATVMTETNAQTHMLRPLWEEQDDLQGSAKRWTPGCVNGGGKW